MAHAGRKRIRRLDPRSVVRQSEISRSRVRKVDPRSVVRQSEVSRLRNRRVNPSSVVRQSERRVPRRGIKSVARPPLSIFERIASKRVPTIPRRVPTIPRVVRTSTLERRVPRRVPTTLERRVSSRVPRVVRPSERRAVRRATSTRVAPKLGRRLSRSLKKLDPRSVVRQGEVARGVGARIKRRLPLRRRRRNLR